MTIAVTTGDSQAQAIWEERQARSNRAYRKARRHSALVRVLRKFIPIGATVSFVAFVVWPFIDPLRGSTISVGNVKLDGTRVTMENPRMTGHRRDNRPSRSRRRLRPRTSAARPSSRWATCGPTWSRPMTAGCC